MDWLVIAVIALLFFLWGLVREVTALHDFWSKQYRDGEQVDVFNRFIFCTSEKDAYERAKAKGMGAEPVFHSPHRPGNPDHYYHYHVGNHELVYEHDESRFVNYHWVFEDRDHPRGGSRSRSGSRNRG